MAYADYEFYEKNYFGNVVPETDFARFSERASEWLDIVTYDCLATGLPSDERAQKRIKKVICVLSETLYQIELAEKQAMRVISLGSSAQESGANSEEGVVTSRSSGTESISYATPQQLGSAAKEWNALYAVAGDPQKTNDLLLKIALPLLMGIRTDDGMPILYAGV